MQADQFTGRETNIETESRKGDKTPIYGNYVPPNYVSRNRGDRIPCATLAERVIGFMERYTGFFYE